MRIGDLTSRLDPREAGAQMYRGVADLYPLCRSITGDGVRRTLRYVRNRIPLDIREVPSGTPVFDWTVPKEWNIQDAYIANARGQRVVDFQRSSLHVLNYSVPVRARVPLEQLKTHLYTLPDTPDWIPYRTAYHQETWGFCLSHRQLEALTEPEYEVCIDSTLEDGSLSYGECFLPGASADEVLISCHVCHPSLANDNLSGIMVATLLAQHLRECSLRYSYRFLFIPGTIGSITWLAQNEKSVDRIKHGLVLACVGDRGMFTYKKSRRGTATIDRAAALVLREQDGGHRLEDFSPYGYDERQFCSPGFNLPVGCLMRSPHGRFPEYHTSADNLDLVAPSALAESLAACMAVCEVLENDRRYVSRNPRCEPQLGKRGLYRLIGGPAGAGVEQMALLWVLNLADGQHSLVDIAERSGSSFASIAHAAAVLHAHDLLSEAEE